MPNNGLTNEELIEYLELPDTIITDLKTAQGKQFEATANQFLEALFNKVIYQSVEQMDFSNPFKKYDSYPVEYGDTIENIFIETPKGYKFNKDATDPFTKVKPKVQTLYATINYEMQYETTIEDSLLRRAVLNRYGFMNLIDGILRSIEQSATNDEYFATIGMLNNSELFADGFEEVEREGTDEETAKKITKVVVNAMSQFKLPMTANNKLRVLHTSREEDVLLVIKYDLLNMINLDYLAGVYNLSKVDLIKNIIVVDSFQVAKEDGTLTGEDIDFMILDTRGFDNHVALQDGGMIYNPKGKYTNHFYNLWKIISFKYFYNARAYKLVDNVQA